MEGKQHLTLVWQRWKKRTVKRLLSCSLCFWHEIFSENVLKNLHVPQKLQCIPICIINVHLQIEVIMSCAIQDIITLICKCTLMKLYEQEICFGSFYFFCTQHAQTRLLDCIENLRSGTRLNLKKLLDYDHFIVSIFFCLKPKVHELWERHGI